MSTMTLSEELEWRGFINQTTYRNLHELDTAPKTFYHGYDASADSQTVGNLAAMMFDKVFMRHGWNAVILAGGATSLIGDPGGKDSERPLQDEKTIAHNVACAEEQLRKVLSGHPFAMVNNLDWTKDLTVIDFLRDIGKHFSMTPLVQRDYIAKRIGEGSTGISYTEFSYSLLQALDYLHLYDTKQTVLQLGGADQWGNCLSGVELVRKARGAEVHVMTLPLIMNKATGKKFGKSEQGAVWLDPNKTSPFEFYQFWLNVDDEGAEGYLKTFTELDKITIDSVIAKFEQNRSERFAQKTLAYEVTKLVHGADVAEKTRQDSQQLFSKKPFDSFTLQDFEQLDIPRHAVAHDESLIDLLVRTALASSKSEARRFLQAGAIYINDKQVSAEVTGLTEEDFNDNYAVLRRGKNNQVLLTLK